MGSVGRGGSSGGLGSVYVEGVTFSAKVNVVAAGAEEKTLMVRDLLVSLAFFLTGAVVSVSWT